MKYLTLILIFFLFGSFGSPDSGIEKEVLYLEIRMVGEELEHEFWYSELYFQNDCQVGQVLSSFLLSKCINSRLGDSIQIKEEIKLKW